MSDSTGHEGRDSANCAGKDTPVLGVGRLNHPEGKTPSPKKVPPLERRTTPVVLKLEQPKGKASLGILKLSLSDAVAQRDQEFGGRASLPRMEATDFGDEASTGFYSARGPREFKLNLGGNLQRQPMAQSSRDSRHSAVKRPQRSLNLNADSLPSSGVRTRPQTPKPPQTTSSGESTPTSSSSSPKRARQSNSARTPSSSLSLRLTIDRKQANGSKRSSSTNPSSPTPLSPISPSSLSTSSPTSPSSTSPTSTPSAAAATTTTTTTTTMENRSPRGILKLPPGGMMNHDSTSMGMMEMNHSSADDTVISCSPQRAYLPTIEVSASTPRTPHSASSTINGIVIPRVSSPIPALDPEVSPRLEELASQMSISPTSDPFLSPPSLSRRLHPQEGDEAETCNEDTEAPVAPRGGRGSGSAGAGRKRDPTASSSSSSGDSENSSSDGRSPFTSPGRVPGDKMGGTTSEDEEETSSNSSASSCSASSSSENEYDSSGDEEGSVSASSSSSSSDANDDGLRARGGQLTKLGQTISSTAAASASSRHFSPTIYPSPLETSLPPHISSGSDECDVEDDGEESGEIDDDEDGDNANEIANVHDDDDEDNNADDDNNDEGAYDAPNETSPRGYKDRSLVDPLTCSIRSPRTHHTSKKRTSPSSFSITFPSTSTKSKTSHSSSSSSSSPSRHSRHPRRSSSSPSSSSPSPSTPHPSSDWNNHEDQFGDVTPLDPSELAHDAHRRKSSNDELSLENNMTDANNIHPKRSSSHPSQPRNDLRDRSHIHDDYEDSYEDHDDDNDGDDDEDDMSDDEVDDMMYGDPDVEEEDEDDDFDLDSLSLSPGSSNMMLATDSNEEDNAQSIDFDTIDVESLIVNYFMSSELLQMIHAYDPIYIKWLCRVDIMAKLFCILSEQFKVVELERQDGPYNGEKEVLSHFSSYMITSSPISVLHFIWESHELLDLLFSLSCLPGFRATADWSHVMHFLLCKSNCSTSIANYLSSLLPDHIWVPEFISSMQPDLPEQLNYLSSNQSGRTTLEATTDTQSSTNTTNLNQSHNITRGNFILNCLLQRIGIDNIFKILHGLLLPEESTIPWLDLLASSDLVPLIGQRFQDICNMTREKFQSKGQTEANHLTELCGTILTKTPNNSNTSLAHQLQSLEFTKRLVNIVCTTDPPPVATQCLMLMSHIFDVSYNNGEYENCELAPIVANLLQIQEEEKSTEADGVNSENTSSAEDPNHSQQPRPNTFKCPLSYLAWQLANPILLTMPPLRLPPNGQPPFGLYRLQLLKTVNSLLKTNYGPLHKTMFGSGLVTSVMDVLFRHTTGSLIHLNVADTIGNVMYFERTEWLLAWLTEYAFVEKVATGFEAAARHLIPPISPTSPNRHRDSEFPNTTTDSTNTSPDSTNTTTTTTIDASHSASSSALSSDPNTTNPSSSVTTAPPRGGYYTQPEYTPHLVSICIKLDRLASSNTVLKAYLNSQPRWNYLYSIFVEPLSKQYRELSEVGPLRRNMPITPF